MKNYLVNLYNHYMLLLYVTQLGNGKSFHIEKQLLQCTEKLTISVNEAFTLFKAVTKLRTLPLHQHDVGIYFNFTILLLDVSCFYVSLEMLAIYKGLVPNHIVNIYFIRTLTLVYLVQFWRNAAHFHINCHY